MKNRKSRPSWSQKGDFGTVLVVGGSELYTGAPIFNALGVLRAGADLVFMVGHPRAMNAAAAYRPDFITRPLKSDPSPKDIPEVLKLAERCTAVLIGGGMARTSKVHTFMAQLIAKLNIPMVLDAEALHILPKHPNLLMGKKVLLTPHPGEFQMLTGERVKNEVKDREQKVKAAARRLGVTILLKGHIDVISDGKQTVLSTPGSPYLTKGGVGDLMAGACAAFLAQGDTPLEAAQKAADKIGTLGKELARIKKESLLTSEI